jgi:hypothetical protein
MVVHFDAIGPIDNCDEKQAGRPRTISIGQPTELTKVNKDRGRSPRFAQPVGHGE